MFSFFQIDCDFWLSLHYFFTAAVKPIAQGFAPTQKTIGYTGCLYVTCNPINDYYGYRI